MDLQLAIGEVTYQLEAQYKVLRKIGNGYGAKAVAVEREIEFTSTAWDRVLEEIEKGT